MSTAKKRAASEAVEGVSKKRKVDRDATEPAEKEQQKDKTTWDPEQLDRGAPLDLLSVYLPVKSFPETILDYCGEGEYGTKFQQLINDLVPEVFAKYEGWTLHGAIKWWHWTRRFVNWCKHHHEALVEHNKELIKETRPWMPVLILFFLDRCAERHYGSYEAQILIHAEICRKGDYGRREAVQTMQKLAVPLGLSIYMPVLRYLYEQQVHPITALGQAGVYQLRYHHILREAEEEICEAKKLLASKEFE